MFCAGLFLSKVIKSPHLLRAWYNGSTSASQAEDEGSIPFARTNKKLKRGTSPFFRFSITRSKINYLLESVGICKSCLGNIKSGFFMSFLSAIILNKTPRRKKLRAIIHKQSPFLTV